LSRRFIGSIEPEEETLESPEMWGEFYDVSGNALESSKVREARREEVQGLKQRRTYIKRTIAECYRVTGKAPIRVRWVDVNKGDHKDPNYRSRLVVTELKAGNPSLDHFAAMPPLEAKKALFAMAVTRSFRKQHGGAYKLGFIDISKAYLYAPVRRDVYIQLPEEDSEPGMCGKLQFSLYGTRDAAQNWEREYSDCLAELGFTRGKTSPCTFYARDLDARIVVHGDDFTILAQEHVIKYVAEKMSERYKLKLRGILGPDSWDDKELIILNRIIRWDDDGIRYEPDPRHAEMIITQLNLRGARPVGTPGVKVTDIGEQEPLDESMKTQYRALVARANYLAQDRGDIQYAVKELSRRMSSPDNQDWIALKRLGRYLLGKPRMVTHYKYQNSMDTITVSVDSDWAGCVRTRRSTSGGVLRLGQHVVKTWATTQASVALSSAEAEYVAAVKGSSQALGFQSIMRDLGVNDLSILCLCDSSAAIGIASRTGVGKVRHIAVHLLWLQEKIRDKAITIQKIDGTKNTADLFTKYLDQHNLDRCTHELGMMAEPGRAASAPALQ